MPKKQQDALSLLLRELLLGDGLGLDLLGGNGLDSELAATPLSARLNVVVVCVSAELRELGEAGGVL